ncbi:MAG: gliding motility-associated protein GldE [Crocinitomicaceae bacterium]|nr:gliding motility-associated protein GldE [Crocinitomicaceae bacterium]
MIFHSEPLVIMPEPGFHIILLQNTQPDFSATPVIISLVFIAIALIGSALVSASEVSFFSINPELKDELEKNNSKSARLAISLAEKPKELLATIVIANNFFNVTFILLAAYLSSILFPADLNADITRFILDVAIFTVIILIFGEVVPKYYATRYGKKVLLMMAIPLYYFSHLPPFSWVKLVLVKGSNLVGKFSKVDESDLTATELSHALELTMEEGGTLQDEQILKGIVSFGKKTVRQIMRQPGEIAAVSARYDFGNVLACIRECGFSRIPVYQKSIEKIDGVIFVKDLLPHIDKGVDFKWQKLIRPVYYIPETKKIDDLLRSFQNRKVHLAIALNAQHKTAGLVTLEDVLEEIVGDISDEFDEDEITYSRLDDDTFVFEATMPLQDFFKVVKRSDNEFDHIKTKAQTLGDFVMFHHNETNPSGQVSIPGLIFTIESFEDKKPKRIKAKRI